MLKLDYHRDPDRNSHLLYAGLLGVRERERVELRFSDSHSGAFSFILCFLLYVVLYFITFPDIFNGSIETYSSHN